MINYTGYNSTLAISAAANGGYILLFAVLRLFFPPPYGWSGCTGDHSIDSKKPFSATLDSYPDPELDQDTKSLLPILGDDAEV